MNADKRRYDAANLRSFAFIYGSNSLIYLAGDYKLILTGYSQVSPKAKRNQFIHFNTVKKCILFSLRSIKGKNRANIYSPKSIFDLWT